MHLASPNNPPHTPLRPISHTQMEEFAAKMRGSLEDQLPDLVTNVRRDDGRVLETGPNVLGGDGDVDDGKLGQWIRWIEGDGRKRDSKGE